MLKIDFERSVLTPSHLAAALRTIGVSSAVRAVNAFRMSSFIWEETFAYTGEYKAAEDVREVNHSACAKRLSSGI